MLSEFVDQDFFGGVGWLVLVAKGSAEMVELGGIFVGDDKLLRVQTVPEGVLRGAQFAFGGARTGGMLSIFGDSFRRGGWMFVLVLCERQRSAGWFLRGESWESRLLESNMARVWAREYGWRISGLNDWRREGNFFRVKCDWRGLNCCFRRRFEGLDFEGRLESEAYLCRISSNSPIGSRDSIQRSRRW